MLPDAMDELFKLGSIDDFVSVVPALKNDYLSGNIPFHLMLDIGRFFDCRTINAVRYKDESLGESFQAV